MIEIGIEVREGASTFRTAVRAESIRSADEIARTQYSGGDVTVVFPIDPDRFFVEAELAVWEL